MRVTQKLFAFISSLGFDCFTTIAKPIIIPTGRLSVRMTINSKPATTLKHFFTHYGNAVGDDYAPQGRTIFKRTFSYTIILFFIEDFKRFKPLLGNFGSFHKPSTNGETNVI